MKKLLLAASVLVSFCLALGEKPATMIESTLDNLTTVTLYNAVLYNNTANISYDRLAEDKELQKKVVALCRKPDMLINNVFLEIDGLFTKKQNLKSISRVFNSNNIRLGFILPYPANQDQIEEIISYNSEVNEDEKIAAILVNNSPDAIDQPFIDHCESVRIQIAQKKSDIRLGANIRNGEAEQQNISALLNYCSFLNVYPETLDTDILTGQSLTLNSLLKEAQCVQYFILTINPENKKNGLNTYSNDYVRKYLKYSAKQFQKYKLYSSFTIYNLNELFINSQIGENTPQAVEPIKIQKRRTLSLETSINVLAITNEDKQLDIDIPYSSNSAGLFSLVLENDPYQGNMKHQIIEYQINTNTLKAEIKQPLSLQANWQVNYNMLSKTYRVTIPKNELLYDLNSASSLWIYIRTKNYVSAPTLIKI